MRRPWRSITCGVLLACLVPNQVRAGEDPGQPEPPAGSPPRKSYLTAADLADMPIEELMNVTVITAGKNEQEINQVPASIVIITRKDIERAGYRNLSEILENIPGFYNLGGAYFEGGTNFGVRGFNSGGALSDFMIMVNGVSQFEDFSNSFSTDKTIVPVEAIEKIEVVRGPNAVIYGSSAFLGAVNIITMEGNEKSGSQILSSAGSNQTYKGVYRISGSGDGLDFVFNAALRKTDGLDLRYSDMQSDTNIIRSWGLPADATTAGQLSGSLRYFEANAAYRGFTVLMTTSDNEQGTSGSKPSANTQNGYRLNTFNNSVSVAYEDAVRDDLTFKGRASYYKYTQMGNAHFNNANSMDVIATKSKGFDLEASGFYRRSDRFDFLLGINNHTGLEARRRIDLKSSPSPAFRNFEYGIDQDDALINTSAFTQADYRPMENLQLVAGMRVERIEPVYLDAYSAYPLGAPATSDTTVLIGIGSMDNPDLQFIPRLAAIYSFNRNNVVKFMFSRSNKRPSLLENVDIGSRRLNGLKYSKMQTFEADYTTVVARNYMFSLNLFQNQLDNLVLRTVLVSPSGAVTTQAANAGTMETRGAEFSVKLKPLSDLVFDLGLVYQQTENHTTGYPIDPSFSPDVLGYVKINYSVGRYDFNLFGNYVSEMNPGWNINADPAKSAWYGKEVSEYYKLNFNCRAGNIWRGMFASLHVANLLDAESHYPTRPNSTWTDQGLLGAGRTVEAALGYDF